MNLQDIGHHGIRSGIPRVDGREFPLSFAQQRLWFLDQLGESGPLYNVPVCFRLQGILRTGELQRALGAVAARHATLRTNFVEVGGIPRQVVSEPREIPLPLVDLTGLPAHEREREAVRLAGQEAQRRFDLSRDPLLRAAVFQLGPEDHLLIANMHHIVSDGWSLGIFFRELGAFYEEYVTGTPAALAPLPIQYADFAVWQRENLQGASLDKLLSYWKGQLDGAPGLLELPTDRPRPAVQQFLGGSVAIEVPRPVSRALAEFSRRHRASMFMTLLAAFKLLLYRYSGQTDIVVGSPIAGRNRIEVESLIGFFVNTLVLRSKVEGAGDFRALLHRVRETALEAYNYQDLPFEKLVEELQPRREMSHSPLFQVMFGFQNAAPPPALLQLKVTPLEIHTGTSKFDLILSLSDGPQGLQGKLNYDAGLFDASTAARMAGHYRNLLEAVVAVPNHPVGRLALMTEGERLQIVSTWNSTEADFPTNACIHQLFEEQAGRTPERVAVNYGDVRITYGRLNACANQLARKLQAMGVGPEVLVGIFMERSAGMVVALLAVLKAGGAYVPLDPGYPATRLSFMIEDSGARVILTEEKLAPNLPPGSARVLVLDKVQDEITSQSGHNLACVTTGGNLAYLMYTSGSTGTPKGAAIPHRAVNRLVIHTDYVQLVPDDVVAQVSNCAFDAAIFEIWGALLNGARLTGIRKEDVLSPGRLAGLIEREGVSVMFLTTALFHQLARESPAVFGKLRCLLVGGEAAQPRWVDAVSREGPPEQLLNVYGPTETTTFASWHRVTAPPGRASSIPIGKPIANTRIHVLDCQMQPTPIGVVGELYIGGPGLARGYHNRPDTTADRFVPNPYALEPGGRLYRTGDRARYLPDGSIEFCGRSDQQVKIRGFRVELEEIEAAVARHPDVKRCAVVAVRDASGARRLIGYVVGAAQHPPAPDDLRHFAGERLPDYMVPSAFVLLDDLPLSPNAKVDRAALSALAVSVSGHDQTPALDDFERRLARIWEAVLRVHPVGVRDNFFELGGHSLLAVRLISQIEKAFGRRLPIANVFRYPTPQLLASVLRQQEWVLPQSLLAPLQPLGDRPPFFWVLGDNSNAFLPQHLGKEQPVYGLMHQSQDGRPARYTTVRDLAAHYLGEVQSVQGEGPYWLGGFSFGGLVAFEMAQQLLDEGHRVALLVLLEPSHPGNQVPRKPPIPAPAAATGGRFEHLVRESHRHLGEMRRLEVRGQADYLWSRIVAKGRQAAARLKKPSRRAAYRLYLKVGRPLPGSLQSTYLIDLYHRAAQSYQARSYAGRVVLMGRPGHLPDMVLHWSPFTSALKTCDLPGETHTDVVRVPEAIREMCGKLSALMEESLEAGIADKAEPLGARG